MKKTILFLLLSTPLFAKNICLGNYSFDLPDSLTPLENFNTKYRYNDIYILQNKNYQEKAEKINQKLQDNIVNQYYGEGFYIITNRVEDSIKATAIIDFENEIMIVENNKNYMYDGFDELDIDLKTQYDNDFALMLNQFKEFVSNISPKQNNNFCITPNYTIPITTLKNQKLNVFYRKSNNQYLFGIGIAERKKNDIIYNNYFGSHKDKTMQDLSITNLEGKLILDIENGKHIRHTWVYFDKENNLLTEIFLQNQNDKTVNKDNLKEKFIEILTTLKTNTTLQ